MKRQLAFLLAVATVACNLHAQINVRVQLPKEFFLLYESIPLTISLHNYSGRTIQLDASDDHPWLSFLVNEQNGAPVRAAARLDASQAVLIPAGQAITRTINLLPLFELRSHGNYRVVTEINASGIKAVSAPAKFTVLQGRELWAQTVGLPSVANDRDEYRAYTLLAHRAEREDLLYISVKDDPPRLVYGVLPLGMFLPIYQPSAQIDRDAHLHLLFQNGPRSFGYVEVDPRARIIQRAAFSDYMSRPRLLADKGLITVTGGEQIYPKLEHILTDEEVNPPPPPPPAKKKSWWSREEKPFADELKRPNKAPNP